MRGGPFYFRQFEISKCRVITRTMKKLINFTLGMLVLTQFVFANEAPREIVLETQKINDAVHWMPETIEVTRGEKIKFIVKHELQGGFDFHGFFIPVLKISEQVNRNEPKIVEVAIPKDLKTGKHPIGCQFHPKHVKATLVVK